MRRVAIGAVLAAGLLVACGEPAQEPTDSLTEADVAPSDSASAIIERSRQAHGADVLDRAEASFGFRGQQYSAHRDGGRFAYSRTQADPAGEVRDVLDNDGIRRTVAGHPVALGRQAALAAEGAVNSVVYFALLPYPLSDPAVQPRLVGTDTLVGEPYDLVEVTFRQEGGGRDYQDRFVYWIHHDDATIDYLAYSYEVNGGGARFRQAVNPRTVGGVRFSDYLNYTAEPLEPRLEELGRMFEADSLDLLSEIALDNVRVEPIP